MRESEPRPRVSVALCTYNGERFVAEQLRSILAQSSAVDEIVISDDGSQDATLGLVRDQLAATEAGPSLTILQNPSPLGVTRNFEQAIRACTGELIVLCDQDDSWHPNRIERAIAEFADRPELLLVFSDANLVDASGDHLGDSLFDAIEFSATEQHDIHDGRALDVLLRRNVVTGATVVFRRSLFAAAEPFPEPWVHDEWLAVVAALEGGVDLISEPLIDYRQHGSNEIGASRPTAAVRLARLREPRRERNRRLLARAQALHSYTTRSADRVPPSVVELARRKMEHEEYRSALPAVRLFRLLPILRAAASGSYRQFGRARNDMLRDLVQPDR